VSKIDQAVKNMNKVNSLLYGIKNLGLKEVSDNYFDIIIEQNNAVIYSLNKSKPDIKNVYEFIDLVDVLHVLFKKDKSDKMYRLCVTCRIDGVIDVIETDIAFQKSKELKAYLRLHYPQVPVNTNQG